jgi:hypothetical protein
MTGRHFLAGLLAVLPALIPGEASLASTCTRENDFAFGSTGVVNVSNAGNGCDGTVATVPPGEWLTLSFPCFGRDGSSWDAVIRCRNLITTSVDISLLGGVSEYQAVYSLFPGTGPIAIYVDIPGCSVLHPSADFRYIKITNTGSTNLEVDCGYMYFPLKASPQPEALAGPPSPDPCAAVPGSSGVVMIAMAAALGTLGWLTVRRRAGLAGADGAA